MLVIEGKVAEFFKLSGNISYDKVIPTIRYLYTIEKKRWKY